MRVSGLVTRSIRPTARPVPAPPAQEMLIAAVDADVIDAIVADSVNAALAEALPPQEPPVSQSVTRVPAITPVARPAPAATQVAARDPAPAAIDNGPEVITRVSTSGGRTWGVNVGRYNTRNSAERVLLRVALNELSTLDGSLRRVVQRSGGFDANFMGLTREGADLACRRLQARGTTCFMIGSDS